MITYWLNEDTIRWTLFGGYEDVPTNPHIKYTSSDHNIHGKWEIHMKYTCLFHAVANPWRRCKVKDNGHMVDGNFVI